MSMRRPRAVRILCLFLRKLWRNFRTALNVSWLALRDRRVGWSPKVLGVVAALVGVAPIEWVPGIHAVAAIAAELVLIPALLAFAWWLVPRPVKRELERDARGKPVPKGLLILVICIFLTATAVDTWFDFTNPGADAVSRALDPYLERFE